MVLRLLALVGKELVEVLRRPGALVSLVFGPFLIMAVFGLGYNGQYRPLETVVVVPPNSGLSTDVKTYQDLAGNGLHIAAVVPDLAAAQPGLAEGRTDVIVVAPADAEARFQAGQQSTIQVIVNSVNPVQANYAGFLASNLSYAVNQAIIAKAVAAGEASVIEAAPSAKPIPPEVIAAPTHADIQNVAPSEPQVLAFYGPAVLALILQHLAVTLVALSLVRERTSGVIELFRVAPVNAWEVLAGKVIAFLLIGGVIAFATVGLLVGRLPHPDARRSGGPHGDDRARPAGIARDRPRHRRRLRFRAPGGPAVAPAAAGDRSSSAGSCSPSPNSASRSAALAYLLPATHGISLSQDIMLRGGDQPGLGVLGAWRDRRGLAAHRLVGPTPGDESCVNGRSRHRWPTAIIRGSRACSSVDRALGSGPKGRRFESCRARHSPLRMRGQSRALRHRRELHLDANRSPRGG